MPFDEAKADRAIGFIESLTHIKGRWAGVPFTFIPWQRDLIRKIYGTVKENGKRQYRIVYLEIPKKNGKTELGSAIALVGLVGDDEQGGEVYSAAADREQAGLVFNPAAQMVRNNDKLDARLKIIESQKRIVDYQTNSFYHVLSSDVPTKHGLNPSTIIFDELHAQPNRNLWDVLVEGTEIAREQQLIVVLTTAGVYDKNSICWEVHDYALKVQKGIINDPAFLPIIYAAEKEDDWEDEKIWRKCNPSLNYIFGIGNLRKHYNEVKDNPARQNNFRRFRLNQWVNQISRYIPIDAWDACSGKIDKKSLLKRICYGALDLSSSIDLTAFALVFPPENLKEKWQVLLKFYIPEDNIKERVKRDRVPYDRWVESGYITATPGNVVDYDFVRKDVINAAKIYSLRELAYDPWGAVKLANDLENKDGITMVEHRLGFKSMSPPTKDLLVKVKAKELQHNKNPVLRWCMDNLVVKVDAAENVKPDKEKATERIDGVVALIMALGRAIVHEDKTSVYNKRGLIVL